MKMTFDEFKKQAAERNAQIMKLYQAGLTKADLARKFGLTRERIGQIVKKAEALQPKGEAK